MSTFLDEMDETINGFAPDWLARQNALFEHVIPRYTALADTIDAQDLTRPRKLRYRQRERLIWRQAKHELDGA